MNKKIIIIGAGPGGLTAGMILAKRGFDVTIFEKEKIVGGRNASIEIDGYTFDTGPTFLMMKHILDEMFYEAGKNSLDYLKFVRLKPMYRLKFFNKEVLMYDDHKETEEVIKKEFPGEEKNFYRYLYNEEKRLKYLLPCLTKPYSSLKDMFSKTLIRALPHLEIGRSVYQVLSYYFNDEILKLCFTFQSKYLGMSAWECPGAFAMVAYVEHKWGIYHVIGGLNKISSAMAKVFVENGGKLVLNKPVEKIVNRSRKIVGVKLKDGSFVEADDFIINADFSYAVTNLIDPNYVKKYSAKKLSKKKYSCSTFMIYLGVKKKYNIPHHNIFFAKEYKENVDDIFKNFRLPKSISFYIQNASLTDPTVAPKGKSTIYILVPVSNLKAEIDWEKEKENFKDIVLNEVIKRTELKDLKENIEIEKIITPLNWQNDFNVYYGATFNLAHNLSQMLYFRPRNKFECFENCYLVGGGTHPGSGLPTIFESARITANLISEKYGLRIKNISNFMFH